MLVELARGGWLGCRQTEALSSGAAVTDHRWRELHQWCGGWCCCRMGPPLLSSCLPPRQAERLAWVALLRGVTCRCAACRSPTGIRTGYCGSLTTFASWYLEVVTDAVTSNQARSAAPFVCMPSSRPPRLPGLRPGAINGPCSARSGCAPSLVPLPSADLAPAVVVLCSAVGEHASGPRQRPVCLRCPVHDRHACRACHRQVGLRACVGLWQGPQKRPAVQAVPAQGRLPPCMLCPRGTKVFAG